MNSEFTPKSKYLQAAADEENRQQFTQKRFGIFAPETPVTRKEERQALEACILVFLFKCQCPVPLTQIRLQFPDAGRALVNEVKNLMVSKGLIVSTKKRYVYQLTIQGQHQAQFLTGGSDQ